MKIDLSNCKTPEDVERAMKPLYEVIDRIKEKLETIEAGQRFVAMAELHESEKALREAQKRHARAKAIHENVQRQLAPRPRSRRKARR
ncbi:MAG: hypothetical protein ACJ79R_22195 [Anaeromyxobacteraceae bacterium]